MKEIIYNRQKVYKYAEKWAYDRNPKYYNFDSVGGDCTSFVSQCIYAGANVMNYAITDGWYYIDGNIKSPSWSGVEFLYSFLINNNSVGPYGLQVNEKEVEIGDVVQVLIDKSVFQHSAIVVRKTNTHQIYVASHTFDVFNKNVKEYNFKDIRYIHIQGVRKY